MARGKSRKKKLDDLPAQTDPRAPLDAAAFLVAAQPVLKLIDKDLLARAKASPAVTEALKTRHKAEKDAKRTADGFAQWQERFVGQVGAAWLLSCVFVRTLEDRGLVRENRLAGEGAADSQRLFFEMAPSLTERDYLLTVFRELARFPAARDLFDAKHNPVWLLAPSAEASKALLALFRTPSLDAPAFRFGQEDTRFLGDLYQDLDEGVRKRFALLQTPRFIESFILDRTLEPAIEKFGLDDTTVIDPTCGSGHFLLGSFDRLFDHRLRKEPGLDPREAARKALDAVYGTDINPYAVAIARFRLTLAFLEKAAFTKLAGAPSPPLHLVVADSLLHNPHVAQTAFGDMEGQSAREWKGEEFALEDEQAARDVLHKKYAAVVGNPPYITVKDQVLRDRYRETYPRTAAGKYSLAAPFAERFFQLGREGARIGMITANSFMKREFGKKLIEEYLPSVDLDIIINTSGAYIPGHGTPTVLLFGAAEPPRGDDVLTVLASRGEPSTPADPEQGHVWRSIAEHWSEVGFENEYISVTRSDRVALAKHPWSLAGGGASELKEFLEQQASATVGSIAEDIGFASFTGLDDAFIIPTSTALTQRLEPKVIRPIVTGESVRDWAANPDEVAITPYDPMSHAPMPYDPSSRWGRLLWKYRTVADNVTSFGGKTRGEEGQNWWEWYRWQPARYRSLFRITFADVATHNHFVLDRGGKVFNQTAPIIKLPETASEDDHVALLAYLNSSTACFLLKQICHNKTNHTDDRPENFAPGTMYYQYSGTAVGSIPVITGSGRAQLVEHAHAFERLRVEEEKELVPAIVAKQVFDTNDGGHVLRAEKRHAELRRQRILLQEDLDWLVYRLAGLCSVEAGRGLGGLSAGHGLDTTDRAFEHPGPHAWMSDEQRAIWSARVAEIGQNRELRLLENAEMKRRWIGAGRGSFAHEARTYREDVIDALVNYALFNVEEVFAGCQTPLAARELAALAFAESDAKRRLFDQLLDDGELAVRKAAANAAVPFVAAHLYTASGLTKRSAWEETWTQQRGQDLGETIGDLRVPPAYGRTDFQTAQHYRLRGKLDVPKERFISYPGCESDEDGEPVYGWAGWDHEQRAKALATLYWRRKTEEGWPTERLVPMLAGLDELQFWLELWHDEPSDDYGGDTAANYYAGFLKAELQAHSVTVEDLRAWRPDDKKGGVRRRHASSSESSAERLE